MIATKEKEPVSPLMYIGLTEEKQLMVKSGRRESDPDNIIEIVCEVLNVSRNTIVQRNRTRLVAEARCIAIGMILQVNPHYGLKRVGVLFGGMHHTSIIYMNNLFKDLYKLDKPFTAKVEAVLKLV